MASQEASNSVNATGNGEDPLLLKVDLLMLKAFYENGDTTSNLTSLSDGTLFLMMPMGDHPEWTHCLTSSSFSKRFGAKLKLSIRLSILLWRQIYNLRTSPPRYYLEV